MKQDVLSKVIDIVLSHDADFAFPTTTLDGVDPRLLDASPDISSEDWNSGKSG